MSEAEPPKAPDPPVKAGDPPDLELVEAKYGPFRAPGMSPEDFNKIKPPHVQDATPPLDFPAVRVTPTSPDDLPKEEE